MILGIRVLILRAAAPPSPRAIPTDIKDESSFMSVGISLSLYQEPYPLTHAHCLVPMETMWAGLFWKSLKSQRPRLLV